MKKTNAHKTLVTWHANDIARDARVLLRVDVNVPIAHGRVAPYGMHRLRTLVPDVTRLLNRGARIVLIAHRGDPGGRVDPDLSLAPVARALTKVLETPVRFVPHGPGEDAQRVIDRMAPGTIVMLENLRFFPGEEKNSVAFAKALAACGDVFVNNAFGVCHRKHASMVAITKYLPSFAGSLVVQEVTMLSARESHPFVVLLGGAKIQTKIPLIHQLASRADAILFGGGAALTMLYANDHALPVKAPLFTKNKDVAAARSLMQKYASILHMPSDVVVHRGQAIDIGPATIDAYAAILSKARTIFWNGPMGVIESEHGFDGTLALARTIANSRKATTIVGGGETVAFLDEFHLTDCFTHVSTGGGAMLAFLAGDAMPGLDALLS